MSIQKSRIYEKYFEPLNIEYKILFVISGDFDLKSRAPNTHSYFTVKYPITETHKPIDSSIREIQPWGILSILVHSRDEDNQLWWLPFGALILNFASTWLNWSSSKTSLSNLDRQKQFQHNKEKFIFNKWFPIK